MVFSIIEAIGGGVVLGTLSDYLVSRYKYGPDGYNQKGYNKAGFDREGFDKKGYDREGYNKNGFDKQGYNRLGFNKFGFGRDGYNSDGYNSRGYGRDGFNKEGFNRYGFDKEGYDKEGYSKEGYDRDGYNRQGFNKQGFDCDGFDRYGYNKNGFNRDGVDLAGNSIDYYSDLIDSIKNGLPGIYVSINEQKLRHAFVDIRVYLEKSISAIAVHWYGECSIQLDDNITLCKDKKYIEKEFCEKLYGAKKHCNESIHDKSEKVVDQAFFSVKILEETLELIENFINPPELLS